MTVPPLVPRRRKPVDPDQRYAYEPPEGHRLADIEIDGGLHRRAVCECGLVSPWMPTPRIAVDFWRAHAGVDG